MFSRCFGLFCPTPSPTSDPDEMEENSGAGLLQSQEANDPNKWTQLTNDIQTDIDQYIAEANTGRPEEAKLAKKVAPKVKRPSSSDDDFNKIEIELLEFLGEETASQPTDTSKTPESERDGSSPFVLM